MSGFINLHPTPLVNSAIWGKFSKLPQEVPPLPINGMGWHIPQLLTPDQVDWLKAAGESACTLAVGRDGVLSHYAPGDAIGSYRASIFSEALAAQLWSHLNQWPHWPQEFSEADHVDWDNHPHWYAAGINPLFRFIRYSPGAGELVAHYDAPYVQSDNCKTLMSLVLYLTDNDNGGQTRFLHDTQDRLPFQEREFSDKPSLGALEDVLVQIAPRAGDALLFEHRLLHDSNTLLPGPDKTIVRTDIFFAKDH